MPVSLAKIAINDPDGAAAVWPAKYRQNFADIETTLNATEATATNANNLAGNKADLGHTHDASTIGTGTKNAGTYFRGDGTFAALPSAAAATAGVVALSTDAEALAGAITNKAITPANLAARLATLINAAPAALDTLKELSEALGGDANFAATVTALIAGKAGKTGDEVIAGIKAFTSSPTVPDITVGDSSTKVANTKFVSAATAGNEVQWHTRTGGVASGAIDETGTYPPRPIDERQYRYTNPLVQPGTNGNRVTGGGGMDIARYPQDYWVGP